MLKQTKRIYYSLKQKVKGVYLVIQRKREFKREIKQYNKLNQGDSFKIVPMNMNPQLKDKYESAGNVDEHYFFQDIYMAKQIIKSGVEHHYDIGSRVSGFISNLLASNDVKSVIMLDIRPLPFEIEGLDFVQADATNLDNIDDNSIYSLSSLHAIEHFGLGRYGDAIDPYAWKKALKSMQRKLKVGGHLYFSVPVGKEDKVCFNAHRIFNPKTIVNVLDELKLVSFAYINNCHIYECTNLDMDEIINRLGCYDCGLFIFEKK